ncbi:Zn(2)-C6 fungal-type domain-containing protein [Favolaschia claudopus]|uniref:Zn(2)-C6 fungal-type domain-containing protein n=1 Tax=Favolaschia claudopus TaxID=2862362 RepID=A0AAV9ZUU2_9AGAR
MDQQKSQSRRQLDKGQACYNCRLRCDSVRPICGPCARFGGGALEDCEYTAESGIARSQVLEEQISIIESRIQQLEQPNENQASVGLHNPYQSSYGSLALTNPQPQAGPSGSRSQPPPTLIAQPSGEGSPPEFYSDIVSLNISLPTPTIKSILTLHRVDNFLRRASQIGFFLNTQMFDSISSRAALSQIVCPALIDAICLWGSHLSHSDALSSQTTTLLPEALRSAAMSLSNQRNPNTVIQTIQAEALLAQYFFRNARILEGKYHASTAVSIALSSGFHKIRSANTQSNAPQSLTGYPPTAEEEGERINAFWAVLMLNNTWLAADGSPGDVSYAIVDTPWPLDIELYSQTHLQPSHSSSTVENFLTNVPDHATSLVALHAKAAIVFDQACRLATQFTETMNHTNQPNNHRAEYSRLHQVIESLKEALPPISSSEVESQSLLLVIYSFVHTATIQLNNPFRLHFDFSRSRAINAAIAIVDCMRQSNLPEFGYIDAIVGTLWMAASQVFMTELSQARYNSGSSRQNVQQFRQGVETILAAMSVFSDCQMIGMQLDTARRNYAAIRN